MSLPLNQVLCGDCVEVMRGFPAESVDMVMFSPPYWGLRDYGGETVVVWGGDSECEHEWATEKIEKSDAAIKPGPKSFQTLESAKNREPQKWEHGFCVLCGAWRGQLGLEPHPIMYIDHMCLVCQEVKRVLKRSGSLYLNLGDTYCSKLSVGSGGLIGLRGEKDRPSELYCKQPHGFKRTFDYDGKWLQPKQLMLMPARVAIALQEDGWILRNDIVWHKPNAMPSSVKDRLTTTWEHLFHFVKARRYFYDLDAIRKPHRSIARFGVVTPRKKLKELSHPRYGKDRQFSKTYLDAPGNPKGKNPGDVIKHDLAVGRIGDFAYTDPGDIIRTNWDKILEERAKKGGAQRQAYEYWLKWKKENPNGTYEEFYREISSKKLSKWQDEKWQTGIDNKQTAWGNYARYLSLLNPQGRNPGDFWSITTKPFPEAHFAVYPKAICRKPILSSCPAQICRKCGKPRKRITKPSPEYAKKFGQNPESKMGKRAMEGHGRVEGMRHWKGASSEWLTIGFSDCGCNAGFDAGVVLDPMCGSGTTLVAAQKLGRQWIGIDINPAYVEMAKNA